MMYASDVIDQIGGWLTQGVGNSYGLGYPVCLLKLHIDKIQCGFIAVISFILAYGCVAKGRC